MPVKETLVLKANGQEKTDRSRSAWDGPPAFWQAAVSATLPCARHVAHLWLLNEGLRDGCGDASICAVALSSHKAPITVLELMNMKNSVERIELEYDKDKYKSGLVTPSS
jgi:hypothetical protein